MPGEFADRKFYQHNANVTLMRTTPEENAAIGAEIGRKLAAAQGPVACSCRRRRLGDRRAGQPFDDPTARHALFDAIRAGRRHDVVTELDRHINDPEFAVAAANKLIEHDAESKSLGSITTSGFSEHVHF